MSRPCLSLLLFLTFFAAGALRAQERFDEEYLVVTGGPSLIEWEKFKVHPHDHWWANFVRASRIRLSELRDQKGPGARITWLVYKPSYVRRGARQEKRDL